METRHLKVILWCFLGSIVLVAFAPFLLTQGWGPTYFKDTGAIGDTIGGITAPFVNLIGSALVFFALKAQVDANKLVFNQFEHQKVTSYITEQLTLIRQDYNDFSLTVSNIRGQEKERIKYEGGEAFMQLLNILCQLPNEHRMEPLLTTFPQTKQFGTILERIKSLIVQLDGVKLESTDKKYFYDILYYTYETRFRQILEAYKENRMKKLPACSICGGHHTGVPEEIFSQYDEINILFDERSHH